MDNQPRGRRTEAELNLGAIAKAARATYAEDARFPDATAELTPERSCCTYDDHRCPAVATDWSGVPAWDQLDFMMTKPHQFRYAYHSSGDSFTATAVADLNCDNEVDPGERWVVEGRAVGGDVVIDGPRRAPYAQ